MWFLYKTTQKIQASAGEATTTPLDFTTLYNDKDGNRNNGPVSINGTITNAFIDVLPAPAQDHEHDLKYFSCNNKDNINHTLTFVFDDGTASTIFKCSLAPGYTVEWQADTGWVIYDADGKRLEATTSVYFANILGSPTDNAALAAVLDVINEDIEFVQVCTSRVLTGNF